ncbi:MAG: YdgA family protein [Methanoregula sp.]|jgi:hypothetical protein|nr:YdgA family protein [Methanoregula sp.]
MIDLNTGKEWVIFVGIIAIVGIAALAAYQITGPVGIEERFQNALGIVGNGGEDPEGFRGFALEGDPVLYAVIVCGLGILCYGAYRHFRI